MHPASENQHMKHKTYEETTPQTKFGLINSLGSPGFPQVLPEEPRRPFPRSSEQGPRTHTLHCKACGTSVLQNQVIAGDHFPLQKKKVSSSLQKPFSLFPCPYEGKRSPLEMATMQGHIIQERLVSQASLGTFTTRSMVFGMKTCLSFNSGTTTSLSTCRFTGCRRLQQMQLHSISRNVLLP